jgi:hypothetical protein
VLGLKALSLLGWLAHDEFDMACGKLDLKLEDAQVDAIFDAACGRDRRVHLEDLQARASATRKAGGGVDASPVRKLGGGERVDGKSEHLIALFFKAVFERNRDVDEWFDREDTSRKSAQRGGGMKFGGGLYVIDFANLFIRDLFTPIDFLNQDDFDLAIGRLGLKDLRDEEIEVIFGALNPARDGKLRRADVAAAANPQRQSTLVK